VVKHLNQTWSDGLARGSTGPCFPLRPAVHCSPHQSHVLPPKPGAPHATSTRVTGSREPAPFYPPEDHRKSAHEPEHASTPTPRPQRLAFRLAEPRMIDPTESHEPEPQPRHRSRANEASQSGQGKQAPRAPRPSLPLSLSCHATGTCGPSWTVALHRSGSFIVPPCHHIACRVARSSRRITAATPLIHSSSSRAEPPRSSQGSSETPRRQANPTSQAWSNVHLDEPRVPGAGGRARGAAAAEGARGRERRLCPRRARRRPAEDGDRRAHQVTSRACDPSAPPFFSL
jgi:hypothetical protein